MKITVPSFLMKFICSEHPATICTGAIFGNQIKAFNKAIVCNHGQITNYVLELG